MALVTVGCMAVTGLDGYRIVSDDERDAASAEASTFTPPPKDSDATTTSPPPVDASTADVIVDASKPDVGVDAGPCAKCPMGTARMLCVFNACKDTRRVFVTRKGYGALFISVAKADSECQAVANSAKLNGTWKAWFSGPLSLARDRFAASTVEYRLLDGTQVTASSAKLLTSGQDITLDNPIDLDEKGVPITAADEQEVWTGTDVNGGIGKGTCFGWAVTDPSVSATVGLATKKTVEWTAVYLQKCDRTTPHLYCFEQ